MTADPDRYGYDTSKRGNQEGLRFLAIEVMAMMPPYADDDPRRNEYVADAMDRVMVALGCECVEGETENVFCPVESAGAVNGSSETVYKWMLGDWEKVTAINEFLRLKKDTETVTVAEIKQVLA